MKKLYCQPTLCLFSLCKKDIMSQSDGFATDLNWKDFGND